MNLTVPLTANTVLANVRYRWIAAGVEGAALSAGITQPSATFPVFRISATPPANAIPSATANVLIGRRNYTGFTDPLDGEVDDVRIYHAALDSAAIEVIRLEGAQ